MDLDLDIIGLNNTTDLLNLDFSFVTDDLLEELLPLLDPATPDSRSDISSIFDPLSEATSSQSPFFDSDSCSPCSPWNAMCTYTKPLPAGKPEPMQVELVNLGMDNLDLEDLSSEQLALKEFNSKEPPLDHNQPALVEYGPVKCDPVEVTQIEVDQEELDLEKQLLQYLLQNDKLCALINSWIAGGQLGPCPSELDNEQDVSKTELPIENPHSTEQTSQPMPADAYDDPMISIAHVKSDSSAPSTLAPVPEGSIVEAFDIAETIEVKGSISLGQTRLLVLSAMSLVEGTTENLLS